MRIRQDYACSPALVMSRRSQSNSTARISLSPERAEICRRLPAQNALLDGTPERPLLKICDFGYSKNEYLDSRPKSLSGTPDYIAPEVSSASFFDNCQRRSSIGCRKLARCSVVCGCAPHGGSRSCSALRDSMAISVLPA